MSDWVFGCDICQDVCPVNVKALYTREQAFRKKRFTTIQLLEMLEMTDEEFRRRFSGSPLKRAKLVGLKRNVCVALEIAAIFRRFPLSPRRWQKANPWSAVMRRGALGRLGGEDSRAALRHALPSETDEAARQEIKDALRALEAGS